jgi:uncharacterized membrane protein
VIRAGLHHPVAAPVPADRRLGLRAAWALGAAGVVTQMVFPFTSGGTTALTVLAVVLLAAAALTHAAATRGVRTALAVLLVAGGGGLLAETVGVRTGVPFGDYAYTGTLGPQLLGVPAIVPLAWAMLAYPALLVARTLVGSRPVLVVPLAAWALATWDVFLDPQMVDAGHWRWAHPTPALPGVTGIPLTNYLGWLLVAVLLQAVLSRVVPAGDPGPDVLPLLLYAWTYLSSVLAHLAFFGRPPVALVGGLLMGTVAIPLLVVLARRRST